MAACAMMAIAAAAQQPDPVITSIRDAYRQAKAGIKQNKSKGNEMVTTMRYTVRGSGLTTDELHFFYVTTEGTYMLNEGDNRDPHFNYYPLNLITRYYNKGAKKYYEEYLFDPESERLLFVLNQGYDDDGNYYERRLYFNGGSVYKVVGTDTSTFDQQVITLQAGELRHAFDNLINNPKE